MNNESEKYTKFDALSVLVSRGVARVTIDHEPINLLDIKLFKNLIELTHMLGKDDAVRVILFQSANPDFFIAHADVNLLLDRRSKGPALNDPDFSTAILEADKRDFQKMTEALRIMPKPTLAKLDGIARGGGLEFLAALDMRFCTPRSRLAQPEIGLAFVAGGGAATRWPKIIGQARTLELMLSADDIDGQTAANWGMVNRVLEPAAIDGFVDRLAERIASFSPNVIKSIKTLIQSDFPLEYSLKMGSLEFDRTIRSHEVKTKIEAFLADDGQTKERELKPLIP